MGVFWFYAFKNRVCVMHFCAKKCMFFVTKTASYWAGVAIIWSAQTHDAEFQAKTPRKGVYLSGGKITTQNSKHKRSGDAYTWAGSSFNVVSSVPGQQLLGQQIPDLGFTFSLRGTGQTTCTKVLTHIFNASFEGKMVICVSKIYTTYIINFGVAGNFDEKSETRWVGAI